MGIEEIKIDEKNFVNEATLELLQRRIESEVRKNILLSIGAPVGGGGILAILLMFFLWFSSRKVAELKA
jgi:hypothetical protein